jgi:acyl-CoA thioesterase I
MLIKNMWLLLAVAFLLGCGHPKHAAIPPGATVLVLGDSISYGTGANPGEDYPTLLAATSGWKVINAGVPGDTSANGLERLPALLDEHTPQFVMIELGGNDFLQQIPRDQTTSNLRAILTQVKAKGIPAALIAVPAFNPVGAALGNLADSPIYEQIGKETDTPVVTDVLADVLSKNALKSDPIHPNADGYRKVGETLTTALRKLGFLH